MSFVKSQIASSVSYNVENTLIDEHIKLLNATTEINGVNEKSRNSVRQETLNYSKKSEEFFYDELFTSKKDTLMTDLDLTLISGYYDPLTGGSGAAFKSGDDLFIAFSGSNSKDVHVISEKNMDGETIFKAGKPSRNPFKNKDWKNDLYNMFLKGENVQVEGALKFFDDVSKEYGKDKNIILTGHSLGGGIAQTVAVHRSDKINECIAFNPAAIGKRDIKNIPLTNSITDKIRILKTSRDFLTSIGVHSLQSFNMIYAKNREDFEIIGNETHSEIIHPESIKKRMPQIEKSIRKSNDLSNNRSKSLNNTTKKANSISNLKENQDSIDSQKKNQDKKTIEKKKKR